MAYEVPAGQAERFEQHIGVGLETVFGTAATAPTDWFAVDGMLDFNRDPRDATPRLGTIDPLDERKGKPRVEGTLRLEVAPGNVATFLAMLTLSTDGRHVQSFSVFEYLDEENDIAYVSSGCCANKISFEHEPGGDLIAVVDILGRLQAAAEWAEPNPAALPELPYSYDEFTLTGPTGYELESCMKISLAIDHMLRNDHYGADGTGLLRHMPMQGRAIELAADIEMDTADWETARQAGTDIGPVVAQWARSGAGFTGTAARMRCRPGRPADGKYPITLRAYAETPGTDAVTWAAIGGS